MFRIILKRFVKAAFPQQVLVILQKYWRNNPFSPYAGLTTKQIFTKIYERNDWGHPGNSTDKFFSGTGSHDEDIVGTYIQAVTKFLSTFEDKPFVVDLGCGDFSVGSQIRQYCTEYVACDIVDPLIEYNKEKYESMDVDFRVLDIVDETLPHGDIIFIRQVLQHLSNEAIAKVLPKLTASCRYLVLTEHVPSTALFTHNLEKPTGPDTRLFVESGIVLTSPPFNLSVKKTDTLCEVPELGGIIKTVVYELS